MGRREQFIGFGKSHKSEMIRVSKDFKKFVREKQQNLIKQGFTRQAASSNFVTNQIVRELRKNQNKKKVFEL